MAGNDPLVAEHNARDSVKAGVVWRDLVFGVQDFRNSAGLILTGATTPIIVNSSGTNLLRWAAADASAITFTFNVPGDYHEVVDKLHILLPIFKSTPGNAAIVMTGALSYYRAGNSALSLGSIAPTTAISDATTISVLDLNFSGSALKGKDAVTITLTPDAHATCVIDLYGATVRFIGGLSLYNETDRYA